MARKPKYTIDGEGVPSVTMILNYVGDKSGLMYWYGANGNAECKRVKEESAKFGSSVHRIVENWLRGLPNPTGMQPNAPTEREQACADMLIRWCEEAQADPVEIEPELISKKHKYVGHCDMICTFADSPELFMIDWKSSNHIDKNYALQLAGYAQAYFEMTGKKVDHGGIIRVDKNPEAPVQFEAKTYNHLFDSYVPLFLGAREYYDFATSRGKWKKDASKK